LNNFKNKISMKDSGIVFALSVFGTAIVSLVLAFIMASAEGFLSDQKTLQWVSGVVAQLIIIGCAVGYGIYKKINVPTAVGAKNPLKLWQVALLLVLAFAMLCFMLPVQTFISDLLVNAGLSAPTGVVVESAGDLVLALVIAAVLPSLCEETLYRGFVCNSFARPGKKVDISAVLISSALFAIMHMSPWQTVHPFALGCVIAIVYLATRSIWSAVILHFTNNALVLLLGYFLKGSFEAFVVANWWWIMIIALAIIVPTLWLFVKKGHITQDATDEVMALRAVDRNKSLSFFTAGGVFCLFMWVFVIIG